MKMIKCNNVRSDWTYDELETALGFGFGLA